MPERSEWSEAGGGAKRSPRYHNAHQDAFEERENRLPCRLFSRLSDAFLDDDGIPGVALTLTPRLRALGLSSSAFNLSGWIPSMPIMRLSWYRAVICSPHAVRRATADLADLAAAMQAI